MSISNHNDSNTPPADGENVSDSDLPDWIGYWHVLQYDGASPSVPTYYDATLNHWDVIKIDTTADTGLHIARHPILEVRGTMLLLKDEGVSDEEAERWRVEVEGDRLRVRAVTGPHGDAVGVATRIATDPRQLTS